MEKNGNILKKKKMEIKWWCSEEKGIKKEGSGNTLERERKKKYMEKNGPIDF